MSKNRMSPEHFGAWVSHMKATREWSQAECARQLSAGSNQITRWKSYGAPYYIGLAAARLSEGGSAWVPARARKL